MIVFDRLWATMKRKGVSQYRLIQDYKFSTGQLDRLRKTKTSTPIRSTSFAAFSIAVWTRSRNTAATDKCAISGGASYEHHSISGGERGH